LAFFYTYGLLLSFYGHLAMIAAEKDGWGGTYRQTALTTELSLI